MKKILLLLWVLATLPLCANTLRRTYLLESGWRAVCYPEDKARYGDSIVLDRVTLPHNFDDYYGARQLLHGNLHGTAVYDIVFSDVLPNRNPRWYRLTLEGAGSYVTVIMNGDTLCRHQPAGRVVTTLDVGRKIKVVNHLRVICEHPSHITDLPWVCGGCSSEWGFSEGSQPLGLFRPVKLEEMSGLQIAPFGIHAWSNATCDTLFVETEVINHLSKQKRKFSLQTTLTPLMGVQQKLAQQAQGFDLQPEQRTVIRQAIPIEKEVTHWTPENPFLYRLACQLKCPDLENDGVPVVKDEVAIEIGFRQIEWGRQFKIDGKPVFLNGICEYEHNFGQSHAFSEREIDFRSLLVKSLGYNSFRDAHQPHNLRYQRNWNRLGITYWAQFSAHIWYDTPAFRENFKKLLRQWVKERRNDPSLILWGLQNESTLPKEFAEECTAIIKEMDPRSGRLVTTCNGGTGTDWNVVQNWSGTYGGKLENYAKELKQDNQLLNGEYGAWRTVGLHDTLTVFNSKAPHSEEKFSMLLQSKMDQAWSARDSVCGQYLWLMYSHDNPGRYQPDEALRLIDKVGPYNYKGLYTIWGQPTDFARKLLDEAPMLAQEGDRASLLLKGTPDMVYLYRYNCGGDSLVDNWGQLWIGDDTRFSTSWAQRPAFAADSLCPVLASQGVTDGEVGVAFPRGEVEMLPDVVQPLARTFRWGRHELKFRFPVERDHPYRIDLFSVEPWMAFAGARVYDIAVNGLVYYNNMDIARLTIGRNRMVRTTLNVNSGDKDYLEISFPNVKVGQAVVSAIAISTTPLIAEQLTMPQVPVAQGYPYSAGLTWAQLDTMTLAVTPKGYFPNYDANLSQDIKAPAKVESDGSIKFEFTTGLARENVLRFRYKNVTGATVRGRWELQSVADRRVIAQGVMDFPVTPAKWKPVSTTTGSMVNAGSYLLVLRTEQPLEFDYLSVE